MKGFNFKRDDGELADCAPCRFCKHKQELTVGPHCYSCIETIALALHKPNVETDFTLFEAENESSLKKLLELQGSKQ